MAVPRPRSPLSPARAPRPRPSHLRCLRVELADGARTTLHVAAYDVSRVDVRVVRFTRPMALEAWCRAHDAPEAIVGGFFVRSRPGEPPSAGGPGIPLGEVRTSGIERASMPFDAPWGAVRACVHAARGRVRIARRTEIEPAPAGDLLQAGPLLVRDGEVVTGDAEGFSPGARQFDSDITKGRYPRAALALARGDRLLAVACDGRADTEAGLTLGELAETLAALGALQALNLDGGGSTSLVCGGRLRNHPREDHGVSLPGGRPVSTALVFAVRG